MTEEVRFILSADDTKSSAALKRTEDHLKRVGTATGYTKQQMQQLSFQMTDIVSGLATGQSPFMILMQQGGQLRDTFGGLGGAVRAVASVFTLGRVAALGLAGGVATVATAAVQGWQESNRLRDAIALTGNAAGLTAGRFNTLAETIAATSTATIGEAREMTLALAETGRVGAPALDAAARAAVAMQKATGASVDVIVKDFARAQAGVAKWAQEANERYHFLTVEQYKLIAAMEKQGKTNEAMAITFDALARPFKAHEENLGSLERMWRSLTQKVSEYKDALLSIGRTKTLQEELAEVEKGIANLQQPQRNGTIRPGRDQALANAMARRDALVESIRLQGRAADSASTRAAQEQAAIAAAARTPTSPRGFRTADPNIGPPTFDEQFPFPDIAEILRSQRDNASGNQAFRRLEIGGYDETDTGLRRMAEQAAEDARYMTQLLKPEWQKLAENWENTTIAMQEAGNRFSDGFVDAGRDAFQEFMRTGKLSADGFKNLFIQTLTELIYDRILAKQMGQLGEMLWSYVSTGATGGGWGFGASASPDVGPPKEAAGTKLATGTNYVPYDGFRAVLHRGEAVVPARYNPAAGGMGGASVVIYQTNHIGQGVQSGQVVAAMRMAKDEAVGEITRRMDRGNRFFSR